MAAANYAPARNTAHTPVHGAQAQHPITNAPAGTFAPGTKVQVGSHRVVIERYLSEGGFAHVYVVRVPLKDGKHELAVLKRVAVPDKEALSNMRTEVETMKKLQGHKHIVRYIESHASQLKGGGYEVFLLMEFCAGGGLIDFMNTRLQYRLTEPEILNIFSDVAEGVATMHYLKPPLLHRDLKVENVLISMSTSSSSHGLYKLCDFGSTAQPRPAATTTSEARLIEDDIQRHTTMQYRSPEMIDVWRKQPIDEKSDIWALGVLLYKLCYYTTPFEEVGQMAILNAKFKFPHHPHFSQRLRGLISAMLKEDPKNRPNIYQVIQEVCSIRGTSVPIKDIYSRRSSSEVARNQQLPPKSPQVKTPPPAVGISHSPPKQSKEALPEITPMRRGRPTATLQQPTPVKPASGTSPARGDPFAALDSSKLTARTKGADDLSSKFPSLDDFSIATDKRGDFDFSKSSSATSLQKGGKETKTALIQDQASKDKAAKDNPKPKDASTLTETTRPIEKQKPLPAAKPTYVSTGTMTSSTPPPQPKPYPEVINRPIWKVPDHHRSESLPRPSSASLTDRIGPTSIARSLQPSPAPDLSRQKGSTVADVAPAGNSEHTTAEPALGQRPVSGSFVGSNLDFLRDHETTLSRSPPALGSRRSSSQRLSSLNRPEDHRPTNDDTTYLRDLERDDEMWEKDQLNTMSLRAKRASAPSVKLSERFAQHQQSSSRGASPSRKADEGRPLSPVAASDATVTSRRPSILDTSGLEELEDLPPEMRREMERQLALEEERRVAAAAAQYRSKQVGGPSRASTIQQRVQSLLDEGRQAPVHRTAAGYGHYTDTQSKEDDELPAIKRATTISGQVASQSGHARQPIKPIVSNELSVSKIRPDGRPQQQFSPPSTSASAPPASKSVAPRPSARPKPAGLRSTTTGPKASQEEQTKEWQSAASTTVQGSRLAALLAKDQEGVAEAGPGSMARTQYAEELLDVTGGEGQDWELDFSKRFPSLSGLDMVETEILPSSSSRREMRIKDV